MKRDEALEILEKVKTALSNPEMNYDSTEDLFDNIGINQEIFELAYNRVSYKTSVVLKRSPNGTWVNQYNRDLLCSWNANMDIQYITDAYSVVVYIITYISKAERNMGMLLDKTQKESLEGNVNAKEAFQKLGTVYLHNREVSAQEAVYRLTNMHLKECSRKSNTT